MPTAKQIIDMAMSQVGTTEYPPNSNNCIYNTEFYGHQVQDGIPNANSSYPWCAVFVWWCFNQFDPCLVYKTASCMNMAQWFKDHGQWHASPKVGDVVFFKFDRNNNWTNHVGIVKEVLDGGAKLTTIEGNTSAGNDSNGGQVQVRTRTSNIVGYGRPNYDDADIEPDNNDKGDYSYGMDVSECQGNIDWQKVKDFGISFACMRSTKKNGSIDGTFKQNLAGCIQYGIDYSCYKYAYAINHDQARQEADTVINLLKDIRMPIWYDLEDASLVPLGKDGIEGIALSFIGECKEAGFEVGIYCNKNWYDNYISEYLKNKYQFWIARYGKNTGYLDEQYRPSGKNVIAWQYTSKGHVSGIDGYVDLDVLF